MEYEAVQKLKEKLLEIGKEKQKETLKQGNNFPVLPIMGKTETHNTQKEISEELGWGHSKVAQADIVSNNATAVTKEKLRTQKKGTNNSPLNNYF